MSLPMPASVDGIARTLVAVDDAYSEHLKLCQDSPCLNCDTLAIACGDAMIALREAVHAASQAHPPSSPVGETR